jgi:hypothetical protein
VLGRDMDLDVKQRALVCIDQFDKLLNGGHSRSGFASPSGFGGGEGGVGGLGGMGGRLGGLHGWRHDSRG